MQVVFSPIDIDHSLNVVVDLLQDYSKNAKASSCIQRLQTIKLQNNCDQKMLQLAVTHILSAENIAAGGFEGFINALNENELSTNIIAFNENILQSLLLTFVDSHYSNMLIDGFKLVGLHGKTILSSHPVNGDSDVVEYNTSCFFDDLTTLFKINSTKFLNPRLVCIDGFIETASEIHRVLEAAASSKETVILFVRGLSEEVIRTLKLNYDRGSLCVIPVIIKYDIEGANLLNDIATINASDVVSSYKGQLISNIDIMNFNRVESVDVTPSGILIENNSSTIIMDAHIKFLQEKIIKSENEFEKEVLTKRIQSLGMNRITIKLKESKDKLQKSLEIDRALRAIKNARSHGVCEMNGKLYPYIGLVSGAFYAKKFFKRARNLGALISD